MRFPWEHDLRRTCNRCGEFWEVPYLLRRPKQESLRKRHKAVRGELRTSRLSPWRGQRAAVTPAQAQRSGVTDERELILALSRCPSCLTSNDFTDERLPHDASG